MIELRTSMASEARRIEEDAEHSFKGHYNAAARWARYHLLLGLPSAATAVLGGTAVLNNLPEVAVAFALLSSALTVVLTFLKPSEHSELHKSAAGRYLALRNRARILREIRVAHEDDLGDAKQLLLALAAERDELNQFSPTIAQVDYVVARKGISEGESRYKVDEGMQ